MKKTNILAVSSALSLACVIALGGVAYKAEAATTAVSGGVNVSAGAEDNMTGGDNSSSVNSGGSVGVGASVSGEGSENGGVKGSENGEGAMEVNSDASVVGKVLPVSASATATAALDAHWQREGFVVSRGDVESEAHQSATSTEARASNPSSVNTADDLKVFASALVKSDSNIDSVKIGPDSGEVRYSYSGKFLGIFSVHPVVTASVDASGNVSLKKPWYDIFITNKSDLNLDKTKLQSDVNAEVNASVGAGSNALAKEAAGLKALAASLKANAEASASTSATTNTSVNY